MYNIILHFSAKKIKAFKNKVPRNQYGGLTMQFFILPATEAVCLQECENVYGTRFDPPVHRS
jgi:hypothetical protein